MYDAVTGWPCTTCARTSNGDRFGRTQYNAVVRPLATGDSMTWLQLRRWGLNRRATKSRKVKAADKIADKKAEKKTAIAVSIESSQRVTRNAFSMAGSSLGPSKRAAADSPAIQAM